MYLEHTFKLSDEQDIAFWVENAYWHVFTGKMYLQTAPPIDPSSLSHWRTPQGEEGVEESFAQSIDVAKRSSVITPSSARRLILDTTVMPTSIAFLNDSALLETVRQKPLKSMVSPFGARAKRAGSHVQSDKGFIAAMLSNRRSAT